MSQKSYDNSPTLYLIPTPIGNMDDITLRALETLKMVDVVFCEDTRETMKLLKYFGIEKKLYANHKFNEIKNIEKLLEYLSSSKNVGLVSDRGTPVISDPGYVLASAAIDNGYNVVSLPGPTALVPALTASGLDAQSFLFVGFLNSKASVRKKELERLKQETATMIFYEAPHRINETLIDMGNILGNNRKMSISREITKKHEEIYRGSISEIIEKNILWRGELVLVVEGNNNKVEFNNMTINEHISLYVDDGMTPMDAIKSVARERGVKKSIIYEEYLKNKNKE